MAAFAVDALFLWSNSGDLAGLFLSLFCISQLLFLLLSFYFIVLFFGLSCPSGWLRYLYFGQTFLQRFRWVAPSLFYSVSLGFLSTALLGMIDMFSLLIIFFFWLLFEVSLAPSWAYLSSYFSFLLLFIQFILGLFTVFSLGIFLQLCWAWFMFS